MEDNEVMNPSLWNYEVIAAFNEIYYDKILTKKDVTGSEKVIKEVTEFITDSQGTFEDTRSLNNYFFILQKNNKKYLLPSEAIGLLPIMPKLTKKVGYNKEAFELIERVAPAGFKPERTYSFREVIDNFAFFKHTNSSHFKLWKIIALTAYLGRINVRVSSEPAFGKDSVIALLDDLNGRIGVVQKPTLAKLEYLTHNKLLLLNEFMNLGAQETRDIEQYLLTVGDFKNKYQKRSRANQSMGGSEEYDISNFSVLLAYNTLTDYPDGDKCYFDFVHTKQLKERFLPFKFDGKLTHTFIREVSPKTIAQEHQEFYKGIARSIRYYSDDINVRKELKPFPLIDFDFKDRWKINFDTISKFINLYANDEKEYKGLINTLYMCHVRYMEMINGGNSTLNNKFYIKVVEGDDDGDMISKGVVKEEFLE